MTSGRHETAEIQARKDIGALITVRRTIATVDATKSSKAVHCESPKSHLYADGSERLEITLEDIWARWEVR
jgi:hypothetical protein